MRTKTYSLVLTRIFYCQYDFVFGIPFPMCTAPTNGTWFAQEQMENVSRKNPGPVLPTRKRRDRSNENIAKNWKTWVKSSRRLQRRYGAEVYIYIKVPRRRKQYLFVSHRGMSPLTLSDVVSTPPPLRDSRGHRIC